MLEAGTQDQALETLKQMHSKIQITQNVEKILLSTYYKYQSLYHLKRQEYADFYHNSVQFLAYVDEDGFSANEMEELCMNMALAILVSQKIFNFSELLDMKYFSCLKTGNNSWIYRLMQTYNDGNVAQFNLDIQEFSEQINSNPVLSSNKNT